LKGGKNKMSYKIKGMFGNKKFVSPKTFRTLQGAREVMVKAKKYTKTSGKYLGHYKQYKNLRVVKIK